IDAASDFFGEENVPRKAITMGVGSIMKSRKIYLMAWGEGKASVIRQTAEGDITDSIPATFLHLHPSTDFILDDASASKLTRYMTPWLVGHVDWDDTLIRKAVVWLCQKVEKPILKLTDMHYNEHGMNDLINDHGPAYNININVFNQLQRTIT